MLFIDAYFFLHSLSLSNCIFLYLSIYPSIYLELYLTIYFAPFISLCLFSCLSSLHFLCACTTKGITGDLLDRAREYLDKLRARDRDDENGDDFYNPSIGVNIPQRDKHQVNYKSMIRESGHIRVENSLPSNDDYSDGDDDMDDDPDESQRVSTRNDYLSIILCIPLQFLVSDSSFQFYYISQFTLLCVLFYLHIRSFAPNLTILFFLSNLSLHYTELTQLSQVKEKKNIIPR